MLDSGGVSRLAHDRDAIRLLKLRGMWPPVIPAAVLVEVLTGDHRRDHHTNRLIALSSVHEIDESLARRAGTLRTNSRRGTKPSAVDALAVAVAETFTAATIVTSDPKDITALAAVAGSPISVERA